MPLMPGAEPFAHDAPPDPVTGRAAVGALLCHGFTGTPQSLRGWGEYLAAAGLSVRLPRLPGHGTTWQEMNDSRWPDWYAELDRAFLELAGRCDQVFVMGLSMGGTLALRIAESRPDQVAGLVLVNPSLHSEDKRLRLLPALRLLVPSLAGIAGDIKKPGTHELSYDRVPVKALHSLSRLWALTKADLGRVIAPMLVFRSAEDHVVEPSNTAYLLAHVGSREAEERVLTNSYHVATLDNDAETIFAGSVQFVRQHSPATTS